jgi:hypothetical protein
MPQPTDLTAQARPRRGWRATARWLVGPLGGAAVMVALGQVLAAQGGS